MIKANGKYKIGKTINIDSRIGAHQTSNHNKIELIASKYLDNYEEFEFMLLSLYNRYNIRGEWFNFKEEQVKLIKEHLL